MALRFLGRTSFDRFYIEGFAWAFDRATGGRSWPLFKAWGSIQLLRCCSALGLLVAVFALKRLGFAVRLIQRLSFIKRLIFIERLPLIKRLSLVESLGLVVSLGFAVRLSIGVVSLLHRRFIEIATLTRVVTTAIFEFDVLKFPFRFEAL